VEDLPARIQQVFGKEYPKEEAIRAVAILMNASYPITFTCPGTDGEPVLRKGNIARVYQSLLDHCRRAEADGAGHATS